MKEKEEINKQFLACLGVVSPELGEPAKSDGCIEMGWGRGQERLHCSVKTSQKCRVQDADLNCSRSTKVLDLLDWKFVGSLENSSFTIAINVMYFVPSIILFPFNSSS